MDEGGAHGDTGDQFHRNEAISAVADDGFLAEEDEDYEDLYNDVNVGEGFRQSLQKNEDSGVKNDNFEDKKLPPPPPLPLPPPPPLQPQLTVQNSGGVSLPGVGGVVEPRVSGFQNQGFIGNELGVQGGGNRVELGQKSATLSGIDEQGGNAGVGLQGIIGQQQPLGVGGFVGGVGNDGLMRQGQGEGGAGGGGGNALLFVGELHWWTTDADLEAELCKYGQVKDLRFFDEKASGKSKGYCQVEFYDSLAATACKERMNGHAFNGRPCVVSFATPFTVKKMGEAQHNRNQPMNQTAGANPGRKGPAEVGAAKPGGGNVGTSGNYQGGDGNTNNNNNNNRGYGRGNWGRGNNPGMGNRGPVNPMRNRGGGMGGRGMMGNGGNGYGPPPPMMHPQSGMNQGFDPSFGGPMGRMGNFGGFPGGPTPPFSGMMPSYPGVGMHGVSPHVNPAFFGRGMPMNGMGMIPPSAMDGHGPNMGMWPDQNMGGWGGDDFGGGKVAESSYGEEAASDHQYGEVNPDRAGWPNAMKEKDRGSERDWSGTSERKFKDDRDHEYERDQAYEREVPREKDVGYDHEERRNHDDREMGRERSRDRDRARSRDHDRDRERGRDRDRERDRHREGRDKYMDHHRYKDREAQQDDEWERGRSSRTRSKSRLSTHEEEHHSRKDSDYGKRRRLTSE